MHMKDIVLQPHPPNNERDCMNVRQLIAKLKKMPQDAEVVFQDHDNEEDEYNSVVGMVFESSVLSEVRNKQTVVLNA